MELYVKEKPKECSDCIFCEKYRYGRRYCSLNGIDLGCFDKTKECPLKTLAEHDAEKDAEVQSWKDGTMVVKLGKLEEQLADNERKYEVLYKLFSEQHEIIDQYELECFEEVNRLLKEQKDFYVVEKDEYDKMVSGAKQFAKETAIAELEKVKDNLRCNTYNVNDKMFDYTRTMVLWNDLCDVIKQQIKTLKGGK